MKTRKQLNLVMILLFVAMSAMAQVTTTITFPDRDCINPGEGRIFVMPISDGWGATWTTNVSGWSAWGGNLGGIAGADAKCQSYAEQFGLPGQYEALISGTPPEGGDRLIKHWEDDLKNPATGALIGGGMTSDGDVLKIKDAFTGYCGRLNLAGSSINYSDVVLLPDNTQIVNADPASGSPDVVHGYEVHITPIGNIPLGSDNCTEWGDNSTSAEGWSSPSIGVRSDYQVGSWTCSADGQGIGIKLNDFSCRIGLDHGIFCVGK